MESLTRLLTAEGIQLAVISGLGAVRYARVAYLNAEAKQYEPHEFEEQLEVVSLIGNAALKDGEPVLHLHMALARRDLSVFGVHLQETIARPTVEVWLQPEDEPVRRQFDPALGMAVMQLPEELAAGNAGG